MISLFFYCVDLLFAMGGVMNSFNTLGVFFMSLFPSLTTVSVVATNAFSVSSKYPLVFLTVILGLSYFFGNGSLIFEDMISVLIFSTRLTTKSKSAYNSDKT